MIKVTLEHEHTKEEKECIGFHHYLEGAQKISTTLNKDASLGELLESIFFAVEGFGYHIGPARRRRLMETLEYSNEQWEQEEKEEQSGT